jgi:hypothetical protein
MSTCKRDYADPLIELLLKKYHLNMLRLPQEGVEVGQVVIQQSQNALTVRCKLTDVFSGAEPHLNKPEEVVAPIEDTASGELRASSGLGLLDKLLQFVPGASARAKAAYSSAHTIQIKLKGVTRQSVDFQKLSKFLRATEFRREQTLYHEDDRLFVITSVVRATNLEIKASGSDGAAVEAKLGVKSFGEGETKINANSKGGGKILYSGKKQLAIGVELFRIDVTDSGIRLRATNEPLDVRDNTYTPEEQDYAWIGHRESGDAFIELQDAP